MMTGKRCLLALAAVACGLFVSGCADVPGMAGYTGQVINASGSPISGAQVRVVPLPAGGVDALEAMAVAGQLPEGWHCATDARGGFLLRGMPTGRYHTPGHEGEVDIKAQGKASDLRTPSEQFVYQPGMRLGLVVSASGYRPFVASVIFPVPSGTVTVDGGPIKLVGKDLSGVKVESSGLKLTLVPLGTGEKRLADAKTERGHDREAGPSELQTIEVPLSAVVRVSGGRGVPPPE